MAASALRLAERPGLRDLGRWVHMLGFRGHFVTKSRGYSTTLGELRAARAAYRAPQDQPPDNTGDAGDTTAVLSFWQYIGSGYLNPGDVLLAAGVEPPYAPPEKHCSICAADLRNQRQPDGWTSGLRLRRSRLPAQLGGSVQRLTT